MKVFHVFFDFLGSVWDGTYFTLGYFVV